MSPGIQAILFSKIEGRKWIETILPSAWGELCQVLEARAGIVVLKSPEEDSYYESASFGYGEDGFFYSFLTREGRHWDEVMGSDLPCHFSGKEFELFGKNGDAKVFRIQSAGKSVGFLLMEWEEEKGEIIDTFLYLFSEKIGKEWGNFPARSAEPIQVQVSTQPAVLKLIPNWEERILALESKKIITILGPSGSGKKTFSKWIHSKLRPGSPFLVLGSLPENLGKLEKALSDWGREASQGSLVFLSPKSWSLGQQKIVLDWLDSGGFNGLVFFIDRNEPKEEMLPAFERMILKDKILIPGFDFLPKEVLLEIANSLFQELAISQNRNGILLSQEALLSVKLRDFPSNFSDLKNLFLSSILRSKTREISLTDLGEENVDVRILDNEDLDLRRGIQALERQKILLATRIFSGNQIRMAKALGISRGSLQYKMKQLGLL
ncbi:Fis family transcriptional regulator [Leptospira kobayashii]|uniref:Fis family transcriptional regulator n=1 Tax=Leptospira kobayashii TaxID=1917830 RepID=A0ABM7UNL0_9LEPT|nr:helix-turn-helix domain-containing protein [Leptospira kobayashii]BDA80733.1 Fis family transcriptional regulator [Leptospira kobayashii]